MLLLATSNTKLVSAFRVWFLNPIDPFVWELE